jgi:hypothetical protein
MLDGALLMKKEGNLPERLEENPLLKQLIDGGAATSLIYWGYVGPPTTEARITFYPSLNDLSVSLDIAREDIIHVKDVPETLLPFGAKVIWVKRNSDIGFRYDRAAVAHPKPTDRLVEVNKGRLRMQVRAFRGATDDDCYTPCNEDCHSRCSRCMSICQYKCNAE